MNLLGSCIPYLLGMADCSDFGKSIKKLTTIDYDASNGKAENFRVTSARLK